MGELPFRSSGLPFFDAGACIAETLWEEIPGLLHVLSTLDLSTNARSRVHAPSRCQWPLSCARVCATRHLRGNGVCA